MEYGTSNIDSTTIMITQYLKVFKLRRWEKGKASLFQPPWLGDQAACPGVGQVYRGCRSSKKNRFSETDLARGEAGGNPLKPSLDA